MNLQDPIIQAAVQRHLERCISGEQARAAAKVNELLDKAIAEKEDRAKKDRKDRP